MPYLYQNFCHETLEETVNDEFDNGIFTAGSIVYAPTSYSLGLDSAVINYAYDDNKTMALTRVYPTCTEVGYPSIIGLTMNEAIILNSSVVLLWCIAFGIKAARRTV